jgi:hypothetical protein
MAPTTESENDKKRKLAQLSMEESFGIVQKYKFDNTMHKKISRSLLEMIALDNQPFSIVEDIGFMHLFAVAHPKYELPSRTWLRQKQLPISFEAAKASVSDLIANEEGFWFTSDLWSTEGSHVKMLSLTCHFINNAFEMKYLVLGSPSMPEQHTAQNIFNRWVEILLQWNILSWKNGEVQTPPFDCNQFDGWSRVVGIVTDNGSNMRAAIKLLPAEIRDASFSCIAHTLQLVIEDAIDPQRARVDTLAVARNLVRYIKQSSPAAEFILQAQRLAHVAQPLVVIQDVATRWDSQLTMLERLLELRPFISMLCTDDAFFNKVTNLSDNQWRLAASMVKVLAKIRSVTKAVQLQGPTLNQLLLQLTLVREEIETLVSGGAYGVVTFIQELLNSFDKRIMNGYSSKIEMLVASFLCPNIKGIVLSPEQQGWTGCRMTGYYPAGYQLSAG